MDSSSARPSAESKSATTAEAPPSSGDGTTCSMGRSKVPRSIIYPTPVEAKLLEYAASWSPNSRQSVCRPVAASEKKLPERATACA